MNRSSKKALMTVREKVILHLLAYHKYQRDSDAPAALTQEGIADGVEVGRNNVSKVVNALAQEGVIDVFTKHVKGFASVKKVYFLTQAGYSGALELKAALERTKIIIIDFDGKAHEEELSKLGLFLPKRYEFLELALGVSRGRFDCSSFHEGKVKEERRFVDYSDKKPTVRSFFGRQKELQKLSSFLESDTARVMAVCGIPGIGKTTLLAKFVQDVREQRNVYWYRVHEWVNLKIFLAPLSEFLSQLGRKGLERYTSRTDAPLVGEVCSLLETDLKGLPAVLIIDDIQKADPSVQDFLTALMAVLENLEHVSIICTSREIPSFYSRSAVFKGLVWELMLEGLDLDSSLKLMRGRELPETDLVDIYNATSGHPLFLELVDSPRSALGKNVRMFIEQEVYSKLDLTERRILEIASIFRYPVQVDAFFTMEEEISKEYGVVQREMDYKDYLVDYDTLDTLLAKSLVVESAGRMIGMHDLLRDFFYSRLTPRQRNIYHKAASRYYLTDSSAPAHVEAMYHCIMAKEFGPAVRIAATKGREIISKGYSLPFAPLLATLMANYASITRGERIELLFLEGDILEVKGEWDQAIARFEEIVQLSDPAVDQRVLAEAYRRIGVVYIRRYNYEKAEERLATSLQLADQLSDRRLMVEAYYDLGGVLRSRGRYHEALDYYGRSREMAQQSFDDAGMGKALYGMGQVYTSLMDHEKAIHFKKEALGYIERTGDVDDITRVLIGLGGSLADLGRFAEAARYQKRAIEMGRISGNLELQGYAYRNAANVMLEMEELDQAEEHLNSAMKIFEKLNNQYNLADLHMIRGGVYNKKMEWEWAKEEFRTAIDMVRKINAPLILGSMLYEVAQEYLKGGDQEGATILLREALTISTEESASNLREKVEETIAKIGI